MRVGFLFNHYAVHQVPHTAPYAFELSRRHPDFEVVVACASDAELEMARAIAGLYPGQRCEFVRLDPPLGYRLVDPLVKQWVLARKSLVLSHNLDFFRGLDALVAPERHCYRLRSRHGLDDLRMIHMRHGAGDRQGGFDDRSGVFDLTLLPGRKYVDRLTELGHLDHGRYAAIGWPKFEVVRGLARARGGERRRLFANDNPTVVYNPHFDQSVSSWEPMGHQVLDFFALHREYNLVFAPHVVLFQRRRRHKAHLPRRYRNLPNVWIDTGSEASADMTYMLAADVYLGDVSSQVYEFLLEPRPCVFLNGHGVDWQENPYYVHWGFGAVVDDVASQLKGALEGAFATHGRYLPRQREMFAYTYRTESDSTAAERGAETIARFLETGDPSLPAAGAPATARPRRAA